MGADSEKGGDIRNTATISDSGPVPISGAEAFARDLGRTVLEYDYRTL